ncbi:hypothetical protein K5X82_08440 [Halosquirtibacter xylanolyticus]|uniref:hypothetical protein n=1 Tax=Halosquirtibacter xylanolyticus TaxID=3374599 RepID=UPI00374A2A0C|nr:hypothetical protein K5X82_08440 [Prolixibacteraceae bacterium]
MTYWIYFVRRWYVEVCANSLARLARWFVDVLTRFMYPSRANKLAQTKQYLM